MIENIPQEQLPIIQSNPNPPKIWLSFVVVPVVVALVSGGGVYLWQQNQINQLKNNQTQTESVVYDKTTKPTQQIPSNQSEKSTITQIKEKNIAMVKNEQIVVKNFDTNEEINTGISVKWMDKNSVWCTGFDWTPDGTKIIAPSLKKIFDIKSKTLSTLQTQGSNIFDPSGKFVYYVTYQNGKPEGTWKLNISSSIVEKISDYVFQREQFGHPVSPDGTKIILFKPSGIKNKRGNELNKYLILDMKTKKETEITSPPDASVVDNYPMDFVWSPASDAVAFVYTLNNNDDKQAIFKTYRTIAIFYLSNSTVEKLKLPFESTRMPKYSPNGKYISFENEDGPGELWKVDSDGQNLIKLSDKSVDFYMPPNWSSDSSNVIFTKNNEGVLTVSADGNNKKIFDNKAECAIWAP